MLLLDVNAGVGRCFLGMVLHILLHQILDLSHGCCEEDCSYNICLDYYILDNVYLYSQFFNDVDQVVWLFSPYILLLLLLLMSIDYF
jgi:hypothetical protein